MGSWRRIFKTRSTERWAGKTRRDEQAGQGDMSRQDKEKRTGKTGKDKGKCNKGRKKRRRNEGHKHKEHRKKN